MSASAQPQPAYGDLQDAIGVEVSAEILERSVTHRSYAYENGGLPTNERLEFLGDSVLGLVVTDALYTTHPDLPEGQLAKLRASVVNMKALAGVSRGLGLGELPAPGQGRGDDRGPRQVLDPRRHPRGADRRGLPRPGASSVASDLVHRLFDPLLAESATRGAGLDWKTSLQELTAAELLGVPDYLVDESGPDHQKHFTATARVAGRSWGDGEGNSKKEAEQRAAEAAWGAIRAEVTAPHRGVRRQPGRARRGRGHPRRRARLSDARAAGGRDCPTRARAHRGGPPGRIGAGAPRPCGTTPRRGRRRLRRGADRPHAARRPASRKVPLAAARLRRRAHHPSRHERPAVALSPEAPDGPHLRVRLTFDDGGLELRFVDQRTFGGMQIDPGGAELPHPLEHIARDPFDPLFDDAAFVKALRARRTGVKRAMLDQTLVSGIGNMYADEALWRAKLHYLRPTASLTAAQVAGAARSRARGDDGGAGCGGYDVRRALCQRQRPERLLRRLAGRLWPRGPALPPLRDAHRAGAVHEPVQLLLPVRPEASTPAGVTYLFSTCG